MSEATVRCPGCGRPQTGSIKAMTVDIAAPSWQDTIANLQRSVNFGMKWAESVS